MILQIRYSYRPRAFLSGLFNAFRKEYKGRRRE